jgi:hypothetical protein
MLTPPPHTRRFPGCRGDLGTPGGRRTHVAGFRYCRGMSGPVVGEIIGSVLIVVVLGVALAVRHRRAERIRAGDRDELVRRGARAARKIAKNTRSNRRGSMRGGGTGEPGAVIPYEGDGGAGLT